MSLKNCRDVQRLRDLPNEWLAKKTRRTVKDFEDWLHRGDDRFSSPRVDHGSGKARLLDVPKYKDMAVYKYLNRRLQPLHLHHRKAHGGIANRSAFSSAKAHLGSNYVFTTDVKDCFLSINSVMFMDSLSQLGLTKGAVRMWTKLLICRDRIPQGCPSSNFALNLFFWPLDYWLAEQCHRKCIAYTRVVDDIVLSGRSSESLEALANQLHLRLARFGLQVNADKWFSKGVQPSSDEQLVHSIGVDTGELLLSKEHRDTVLQLLERAVGACQSVQLCSFNSCVAYRNKLHGWYYYALQTSDPSRREIGRAANKCDELIKRKLNSLEIYTPFTWWNVITAPTIKAKWQKFLDVNSMPLSDALV